MRSGLDFMKKVTCELRRPLTSGDLWQTAAPFSIDLFRKPKFIRGPPIVKPPLPQVAGGLLNKRDYVTN